MVTKNDILPDLLQRICSDKPDRRAVEEVVGICRNIASAYLRSRKVGFDATSRDSRPSDAALDLVADLFQRDSVGRFSEFRAYFTEIPSDADECFASLRRLVFSQVSEALFNRYRALDPGLARLIRSLKAAAGRAGYDVEERHGSRWIVFARVDWRLPNMPLEIIEARVTGGLRTATGIDAVLRRLAGAVRADAAYRPAVPVVLAAQLIRSAWSRVQFEGDGASMAPAEDELETLVRSALASTRSGLHDTYVGSGKIAETIFSIYIDVVSEYIAGEYGSSGDGSATSLYERLAHRMPSLDRHLYVTEHRSRLEYMARCAREELVKIARRDLGFSADDVR